MIVWLIGGNSYQFQHLAHMLVIGITVFFIYLIIKELTKSKLISFLGALAYLLSPINMENVFRLGPQEPLLVMFLSILFYLIIKNNKIFLPCLILILAIFTKETSIVLLPILFLYYLLGKGSKFIKNKKQSLCLLIVVCVSSLALILIAFLKRGDYSTNYYFNIPMLVENLIIFLKEICRNTLLFFPLIPVVYLVRTGVILIKKRSVFNTKLDLFEFLFFVGFICFLSIQLPWKFALIRYLMPTSFFLILFSFIEIFQDIVLLSSIKIIKKHKQVSFIFLIGTVIYVCLVYLIWGWQLISRENSFVSYYKAFSKMAVSPSNTTILMNMPEGDGTIELVTEVRTQLSEFWHREDIKVEYLDLQNLPKNNYTIVSSDQLPKKYSQEEINNLFKTPPFVIMNTTRGLVITTPLEIIKQSTKKIFNLLIYKERFTSDGLYTYYYNYNNWYFYHK